MCFNYLLTERRKNHDQASERGSNHWFTFSSSTNPSWCRLLTRRPLILKHLALGPAHGPRQAAQAQSRTFRPLYRDLRGRRSIKTTNKTWIYAQSSSLSAAPVLRPWCTFGFLEAPRHQSMCRRRGSLPGALDNVGPLHKVTSNTQEPVINSRPAAMVLPLEPSTAMYLKLMRRSSCSAPS